MAMCTRWGVLAAMGIIAPLLAGCADDRVRVRAEVELPGAVRLTTGLPLDALGERHGGRIRRAALRARQLLLVSDDDAEAVRVIDPATRRQLSRTWVGGQPADLVVGPRGRIYVALRTRNEVAVLEMAALDTLRVVGRIPVAPEPQSLAVTPGGRHLLVTSGWGARLTAVQLSDHAVVAEVPVAAEPRAVRVEGDDVVISHAAGAQLTHLQLPKLLEGGREIATIGYGGRDQLRLFDTGVTVTRDGSQAFALVSHEGRFIAPGVLTHRGTTSISDSYYETVGYPTQEPVLIDWRPGEIPKLRVDGLAFDAKLTRGNPGGTIGRYGCMLPRAADVDPETGTLFVACIGRREVMAWDLSGRPLLRSWRGRWSVASGPLGLVVDPEAREVYVWSQFERALSVIPLRRSMASGQRPLVGQRVQVVGVRQLAAFDEGESLLRSASAREGRRIFHEGKSRRMSVDGRACASCHVDGRGDGLVWPSARGPRQTPVLVGRLADSAPYGWLGDHTDLATYVEGSVKRLSGKGLRAAELRRVVAYLREEPAPHGDEDPELVATGRAIFEDPGTGCDTCHPGGGSDGARHRVGSGGNFDSPSLRQVAASAPYFHDGRYANLDELLRHSAGTMGYDAELSAGQRRALVAFLRTL